MIIVLPCCRAAVLPLKAVVLPLKKEFPLGTRYLE
ncbi:MAG: hypothetical protein ACI8Z1_001227 [Candidatus Azotimanducaceae bacterium]|jgi:hypothetical protein